MDGTKSHHHKVQTVNALLILIYAKKLGWASQVLARWNTKV